MSGEREPQPQPVTEREERAWARSGGNPNALVENALVEEAVGDANDDDGGAGRSTRAAARDRAGGSRGHGRAAPDDTRDSPGAAVDDTVSPEVPEPNEPA